MDHVPFVAQGETEGYSIVSEIHPGDLPSRPEVVHKGFEIRRGLRHGLLESLNDSIVYPDRLLFERFPQQVLLAVQHQDQVVHCLDSHALCRNADGHLIGLHHRLRLQPTLADKKTLNASHVHVLRQDDLSLPVHRHPTDRVGEAGRTAIDRFLTQVFGQGVH